MSATPSSLRNSPREAATAALIAFLAFIILPMTAPAGVAPSSG